MRVDEAEATVRLQSMLQEVAATANVLLSQITRTCFGLAGLTIPAVRTWATAAIATKVSGSLILCGDEEIALDAAFPGGPGILVIAGTGSNVIGRNALGKLFGAGGWGPVLGDEGAGYWIGLEAVRTALQQQDRAATRLDPSDPSIALLVEIQRHWNLTSLADLVALGNHRGDAHRPAPDFASLAPVVANCAEQGNALAASVLRRAGEDLADLVTLVADKISADSPPSTSNIEPRTPNLGIGFTGSVLTHIPQVRAAMTARLAHSVPTAQIQQFPADPREGALWRARHP